MKLAVYMTLGEINEKIKELGIPDGWLSINGPDGFGATVIHYEYNRKWRVYEIVDHGKLVYDEWFRNLEDALDYAYMQAQKAAPEYNRKQP
jgi:hypothetical protein